MECVLSSKKMNTPEGREWLKTARRYLTEHGMRWVGISTPDGSNIAMISRYCEEPVYDCEYDGKSLGDELTTRDIDEALEWLIAVTSDDIRMTYWRFQNRVNAIIKKAGGGISVCYDIDREKGRYYARCSDGVRIIGNSMTFKVSVRWGSHHAAVAEL